jgi:hypoxanthine phosphoribosyltransferase
VELVKDVSMTLQDRDVLMVEDIIDTGMTTAFLRKHLATHHPRSLRLVSLLDKRSRRIRDVEINFRGFDIPDRFVVGYGLDLAQRLRNLRDIHVVEVPESAG